MINLFDLTYRYFENPYFLLLIIPSIIILIYLITKDFIKVPLDKNQQSKLKHKRIIVIISRIIIFVLLFIALSGPFVEKYMTIQGDPKLKLLIDNSTSMQVFDFEAINNLQDQLNSRLPLETVYISSGEKSSLGDNILVNLKRNENVLLLSDGYSNSGISLGDIVLKSNSLNSSISAINLKPKYYDASITISGSDKTSSGADNTFTVSLKQTERKSVHVVVEIDGVSVLDTKTDKDTLTITKTFSEGYHKITAKLDTEDYFKNNNIFYKTVKVVPKPKILIYSKVGIGINKLYDPLYDITLTSDFPKDLGIYTAVVVDDIEIKDINDKTDLLTDFAASGNGLFVLGGGNSFDSGGYKNSNFEQILPVYVSKAGRKKGENNIVIAIDISGSTGHVFQGSVKSDIEKAIALDMIKNLSLVNNVGVVAFNTQGYKVFDIKPLIDQPDMEDIIMRLKYDGGTYISNGLLMAIEMLKGKGGSKNIILISDGRNQDFEQTNEALRLASSQGIRIYAIGVGEDTDNKNMKDIADSTGGTYFEPDSTDRVRILFGDTEMSGTKKVFPLVAIDKNHFITQNLNLKGNIYGFNQVVPKDSAKLLVTDDVGDPIVAVSRLGLGRVAVLATDYKLYGFELLNKDNSLLLTRIGNWVIGDPERKNDKFVEIQDGRIAEAIDVKVKSDIQPSSSELALYKVDDSLYDGSIIVNNVGFKSLLDGVFAVNYKEEYQGVGMNNQLIGVVKASGGRIFKQDEIEAIVEFIKLKSKREMVTKKSYSWIFALAALLVYLIEVSYRRINRNKK